MHTIEDATGAHWVPDGQSTLVSQASAHWALTWPTQTARALGASSRQDCCVVQPTVHRPANAPPFVHARPVWHEGEHGSPSMPGGAGPPAVPPPPSSPQAAVSSSAMHAIVRDLVRRVPPSMRAA
jgi:hypothetical protein